MPVQRPEDLIDEEIFADDTLAELERRKELEAATRIGAEITMDLTDGGPLGKFIVSRRVEAKQALLELATTDPKDPVEVSRLQQIVKEYLKVCEFTANAIVRSNEADQVIIEEYGDGQDPFIG